MSRTLNLADHLLSMGRNYQELGRTQDAVRVLTRLTGLRDLPGAVAEETQARLGELQLRRRKFARARRHLTAALRHQPDSARYHHLMGLAVSAADHGDAQRALEHFQRSLAIEPDQPKCLCAHGRLALRLGLRDEGLTSLRRAAELAADDPVVLADVVKGLRLASLVSEAEGLLRAALFRNARDPRFRKLWDDFQFQQARREQEIARLAARLRQDGPVLLPFVRPPEGTTPRRRLARKIIRQDGPGPVPPPHAGQSVRFPDQRHAQ
jgi:tetratricopeptide (TPR) repeat protein